MLFLTFQEPDFLFQRVENGRIVKNVFKKRKKCRNRGKESSSKELENTEALIGIMILMWLSMHSVDCWARLCIFSLSSRALGICIHKKEKQLKRDKINAECFLSCCSVLRRCSCILHANHVLSITFFRNICAAIVGVQNGARFSVIQ